MQARHYRTLALRTQSSASKRVIEKIKSLSLLVVDYILPASLQVFLDLELSKYGLEPGFRRSLSQLRVRVYDVRQARRRGLVAIGDELLNRLGHLNCFELYRLHFQVSRRRLG